MKDSSALNSFLSPLIGGTGLLIMFGVALMLWVRLRHPAYFRGETLPQTDGTRPIPIIQDPAAADPAARTRADR